MRLFLSSQDLGNFADVARRMAGENAKAAFIKNAQDDKPEAERNFTTPLKQQMFADAGFEFETIDLRDYFGEQAELEAKLRGFGSVWCAGGNTFILRRAMRASGFDVIIKKLLVRDEIMYGGWSAGACVCAESLHGIEYGDRPSPDVVPESYPDKQTLWEGLGIVPFMIVPHCDQEHSKENMRLTMQKFDEAGSKYIPLNDGQVVIVDGDMTEVLK